MRIKKAPLETIPLPVFLWSKQIVVVGSEGGKIGGGKYPSLPCRWPVGKVSLRLLPTNITTPKNRGYFFIFVHIIG